jgi:catechol 2,3-dioxygenase-like lactoylglutathione lyase family enzyme
MQFPLMELALACSSCAAQEAFWTDLFDAKVLFRGTMAGQPFVRLVACGVTFIFSEDPHFSPPPGPGQEWLYRNHIGLRVADLSAAIAYLEARGAVFTLTPAIVAQMLAARGDDGGSFFQTDYIAPPLTRARIDAGEYCHDVAILVGPDHLWIELNQITEPADTQWYPGG